MQIRACSRLHVLLEGRFLQSQRQLPLVYVTTEKALPDKNKGQSDLGEPDSEGTIAVAIPLGRFNGVLLPLWPLLQQPGEGRPLRLDHA